MASSSSYSKKSSRSNSSSSAKPLRPLQPAPVVQQTSAPQMIPQAYSSYMVSTPMPILPQAQPLYGSPQFIEFPLQSPVDDDLPWPSDGFVPGYEQPIKTPSMFTPPEHLYSQFPESLPESLPFDTIPPPVPPLAAATNIVAASTTINNAAATPTPVPQPPPPPGELTPAASPTKKPQKKQRRKWTDQETNDLIHGCKIYGIGNWKKVLDDPNYNFNSRSSIDLKDRFRTCFPNEYKSHVKNPNKGGRASSSSKKEAPSLEQNTILASSPNSNQKLTKSNIKGMDIAEKFGGGSFERVKRKERIAFTIEEDLKLLNGFEKHGPNWAKIKLDTSLGLVDRRSADLKDRFRIQFPERYKDAGLKPKANKYSDSLSSVSGGELEEESNFWGDAFGITSPAQAASMQRNMSSGSGMANPFTPQYYANTGESWSPPNNYPLAETGEYSNDVTLMEPPSHEEAFSSSGFDSLERSNVLSTRSESECASMNGHNEESHQLNWEDTANFPIFEVFDQPLGGDTYMFSIPEGDTDQNLAKRRSEIEDETGMMRTLSKKRKQ